MNRDSIVGCLLGTAVGDAIGLPYEGLSPQRALKLLGPPSKHRFVFGRGMVSDDTEHTCMIAQALAEAGADVDEFTRQFSRRLRRWILLIPAGVGKATAKAAIKLWLGYRPENAGVFSAGNGPAMRAAILGAAIDDVELLLRMVAASSRVTHRDPKAELGAIAVALAARHSRLSPKIAARSWLGEFVEVVNEDALELVELLNRAIVSVEAGQSTRSFAESLGLLRGVTGYAYHTVPVAIHAWLANPRDFRRAVSSVIECGGDADTTAAIVGGIVGAGTGSKGIPHDWLSGICEWPQSVTWMMQLAESLAAANLTNDFKSESTGRTSEEPLRQFKKNAAFLNPIAIVIRNSLFLTIVLFHGFRRLAPPY